jgi:hypothetical protein
MKGTNTIFFWIAFLRPGIQVDRADVSFVLKLFVSALLGNREQA